MLACASGRIYNFVSCESGDVFAGVGPIALAAAKKVKRVYANDLNPQAVEYMERNCVLNKLERKVQVCFNLRAATVLDKVVVLVVY